MNVEQKRIIWISVILFLVVGVFYSLGLGSGTHFHYDEFHTMERSSGFLKFNDWWAVFTQNHISAQKPPLQYWLTAINFKLGLNEFLALRIWSFVFLFCSYICVGLLAKELSNGNSWSLPAGILMAACSTILIKHGRSAMLDAGMSFFMLAAFLGFLYAKRDERWWVFCGIFIGLGALQKAPVSLLLIAFMLFFLNKKNDECYQWSILRNNRYFNIGFYIALGMSVFWPILQSFRMGREYASEFNKQVLKRFSPFGDERMTNFDFLKWVDWLFQDMGFLAIPLLCAVPILVLRKSFRNNNAHFAFALIVMVIMFAFTLATGSIYSRYLVILTPLLIVLLLKLISDLTPWKPTVLVVSMLSFLLSLPSIHSALVFTNASDSYYRAKLIVELVDSYIDESDHLAVDRKHLPLGAYGYFSDNKSHFSGVVIREKNDYKAWGRLFGQDNKSSVLGVAASHRDKILEQIGTGLNISYTELYRDADTIIWRYSSIK